MTVHRSPTQFLPKLAGSAGSVFAPIQREFDRLFDQLGSGWAALAEVEQAPKMDIRDTDDGIEISLELPGMTRGDVKIAVEDDVLTISGEKKTEKETKEDDYRLSERTYGAFSRSVTLPRSVDAEKVKATMKDGVLKLTAPKDGTAKAKAIEIQLAD